VADDLVMILTALNLEYEAVRSTLKDVHLHDYVNGTRFEIGTVPGGRCRVALALTGKGNQSAGILAERARNEFSPVALFFVGVAGALRDGTPLGDVVMATHVYSYHGGTSGDDGFKARPRAWEAPHSILQRAHHVSRTGDWITEGLVPSGEQAPKVRFAPIAAGEVVQNSRVSYEAKLLQEHYTDALAIEMEGAGVAQAGHLGDFPVAVIRGISDMADGTKKSGTDVSWQPRAAANAAAFAVRLAEVLITEREHVTMPENNTRGTGGTVNNHFSGQAGFQAGHVSGSTIWVGAVPQPANPAGLAAELAAFRTLLLRERSAGRIDETTYAAAQTELEIATEALGSDTAEGKSRFVLALKRLRGLIADVADLATRVAALLVTAKELL
jgi:adenosylhomocysteine nucleosidase